MNLVLGQNDLATKPPPPNLLGLDAQGLSTWLSERGHKPFRARQLMRWIHRQQIIDFASMTDLSMGARSQISQECHILPLQMVEKHTSEDGVQKWLFAVDKQNVVETVFIPTLNRGTLCISSQAGCAVNCIFCSTGRQGFSRNLSSAEIIGQVWGAILQLRASHSTAEPYPEDETNEDHEEEAHDLADTSDTLFRSVTNVVFMGMGEPLLNLDQVLPALRVLLDPDAYGLSRRRVTLSTSGVVPMIDRLREECPVALAVSLHAPEDTLRDYLVPINRKYPLKELMTACRHYLNAAPRPFITFEYVMLQGVNDSPSQARDLVRLVATVPCKFNLIPFNPFNTSTLTQAGENFTSSSMDRMMQFSKILRDAGFIVTIRKTRGQPISAACGQLAGEIVDRTHLVRRTQARVPESKNIHWHPPEKQPL